MNDKLIIIENRDIPTKLRYLNLPVNEGYGSFLSGDPSDSEPVKLSMKTYYPHLIKSDEAPTYKIWIDAEAKGIIDAFANTATTRQRLEYEKTIRGLRQLLDERVKEKEEAYKALNKYKNLWIVKFYNWCKKLISKRKIW